MSAAVAVTSSWSMNSPGRIRAGAGGGWVYSQGRCGKALIWYPGEGVDLAKFPGEFSPGIASIGAAEDLTVDTAGEQKIRVSGMPG